MWSEKANVPTPFLGVSDEEVPEGKDKATPQRPPAPELR